MNDVSASLYEALLQNFSGDLDLYRVGEADQHTLSVLDNVQRILNSRAGSLAHLPDYGLADMGVVLQGLPASTHGLMRAMQQTLLKFEPRLVALDIQLLPQAQPGHLEFALAAQLSGGQWLNFGASLAADGKAVVSHLKQQQWLK